MKIEISDIFNVTRKYYFLYNEWNSNYFSRKYTSSRIYDHFFIKLYYIIQNNNKNTEFIKNIKKNIQYCSNDWFTKLNINKPNLSLSTRTILLPNFYDIIYYEIISEKIYSYIDNICVKNIKLLKYRDNWFFWFAHRITKANDILIHEHYLKWWSKFNDIKNQLFDENDFFIETDIKWFYDNISHDNFILLLKKFFNEFWWDFINKKEFDNILKKFNEILKKVSGYDNRWIPQWLLCSEMLSQIYLWLIFISEEYFTFKDNIITSELWNTKFIYYADDIIFFSKKSKYLYRGLKQLQKIFNNHELELNETKTSQIIEINNYNRVKNVDVNKVVNNDINEISILFTRIFKLLNNDFYDINTNELKTLFKYYFKINTLNQNDKDIFLLDFKRKCINFNKKDIWNYKKISLLITIRPSEFVNLLLDLEKIHNKNWWNFQKILIDNYFSESTEYITIELLSFLYLDLYNSWWLLDLQFFIKNLIKKSDNQLLINLIDENKQFLKSYLLEKKLFWLSELLYSWNINYVENIIWIKINTIFGLDQNITNFLSDQIELLVNLKILDFNILIKMNNILDELLLCKKTNKNYFLKDSSFIADLYSLFNILLSILISIEDTNYTQVKISQNKWVLINAKNTCKIILNNRTKEFVNKHSYLLYFLTKDRAIKNHKEWNETIEDNHKLNNLIYDDILMLSIKDFLYDLFININESMILKSNVLKKEKYIEDIPF